ncbi:HpcH/HpaI aldolase/citrate lyase family protein [Cellulomonas sp. URHD0024]|uniref:HpcH/HpaI aldolase/citrate lyase family protein n=1 Tax=Cellulomonas sp. URHD0024 TaxID=1302620 RepID=UPI0004274536|nr:HpcH/HpaI aldolase/citrate lyase family protein [Cellulomonas sp. URHD0024]
MRHFRRLPEHDTERLFSRPPEAFGRNADTATLAAALGATLYMPATRQNLAQDLVRRHAAQDVMSVVVCLEDAIADDELPAAQANAIGQLRTLSLTGRVIGADQDIDGPLVFVRVRTPEQLGEIMAGLGDEAGILSGFVLPKFTETSGAAFLDALTEAQVTSGRRLFAMPVIESPQIVHRETRTDELVGVQRLLDKHRESVLAVRIGATDMCSTFGIRRNRDLTIWDVRLVAEVITDVVNILGRADGTGFTVTGPVWEYFGANERLFKPQLRETPFESHDANGLRKALITQDLDGLIREVVLDKANGLTGKTVIHPSHVPVVHAMSVVTHEEFADATDVLGTGSSAGAAASRFRNKMNESKPHRAWAERTMVRARAFGVAAPDISVIDLLGVDGDL